MHDPTSNPYLTGRLPVLFARTATPIIFVMSMNGLLTVADAIFLGAYVGPEALAAVTLMFPFFMLIVACSTLVSNGMSSLLARHLGGHRLQEARQTYAAAHWLALIIAICLVLAYALLGETVILRAADGDSGLASLASQYIGILAFSSPLLFVLSINSDALRNEGHVGMMAAMSLLVSLSNLGFNYLLIAVLDLGVAGSAYGTVLAQGLALGAIVVYRQARHTHLHPRVVFSHVGFGPGRRILALGAPQSLGFVGLSLGATSILVALQMVGNEDYAVSVTAYGIVTRVMTFAFLPLLGLSQAMQTITGNNYGAGLYGRSTASLRLALLIALGFCGAIQVGFSAFAPQIAFAFVADAAVVAKVAAIMPVIVALFLLSGPLMMLAAHFQAIGDATRAAVLSLSKPFFFAMPLTFALPLWLGEAGVWLAGPSAEALLLCVAVVLLWRQEGYSGLIQGLVSAKRRAEQ
jgi:putative MATE family efflux protein